MKIYLWNYVKRSEDERKQFAQGLSAAFTGEIELMSGRVGVTENGNLGTVRQNGGIIREKNGKTIVSFDKKHLVEFESDIAIW